MTQIASEALTRRLAGWGVETVFGLFGDGINGLTPVCLATAGRGGIQLLGS